MDLCIILYRVLTIGRYVFIYVKMNIDVEWGGLEPPWNFV